MNALLIAPNVGGFYQDIINELKKRDYEVDYIWDSFDIEDPDFIHSPYFGENSHRKDNVLAKAKQLWVNKLSDPQYCKKYDLLFVVDGKQLHPYLFETLRTRNENIRCINYLYDTTRGNYRFNVNSHLFDRVVTYDRQDSKTFGWDFMPIPWIELGCSHKKKYMFFAMGTYNPSRFALFKLIDGLSKDNNYDSYVQLFTQSIKYYPIKYFANLFLKRKEYIRPSVYYSNFIRHSFLPKEVFLKAMQESEVIVDSIDPRQDGLTARCTWALGAGKKIITNNTSIKLYDFYTPEQILVVEDNKHDETTKSEIISFAKAAYSMPKGIRNKIDTFRMDNWMSYMLS